MAKWGSVEAFQAERQRRAEAQAKPSPSQPGDLQFSVCLFLLTCTVEPPLTALKFVSAWLRGPPLEILLASSSLHVPQPVAQWQP